jgi:hypothetical protein
MLGLPAQEATQARPDGALKGGRHLVKAVLPKDQRYVLDARDAP